MDLIEYDSVSNVRVSHVHFKWTIRKFSICFYLNKKDFSSDAILPSAAFDVVDSSKWQLQITKHKHKSDPPYSIRLILLNKVNGGMYVEGSISVLASDGSVGRKFKCNKVVTPNVNINFDEQCLLSESLDLRSQRLLVNDTLTLLCQLKVTDVAISTSVQKKEGLEQLFGKSLHSDVIFVADGKEFHAHEALVADRCPVLFMENPRKKQQMNCIEVPEGAQVFKELLRFIYTGKCEDLQSVAQDLLVAAEKYKVSRLKSVCEQELIKQTNETNVTHLLVLAHLQGASGLKQKIWEFIDGNSSIKQSKEWMILSQTHPRLTRFRFNWGRI
jgi:speckle-type POZ protein